MKVMFDTNIYISFIRERLHEDILLQRGTTKYLSAIVLMELWAGAKNREAERLLHKLQRPYATAGRIVVLDPARYVTAGQLLCDLRPAYANLIKQADFVNDIQIALSALLVGATLYTENRKHFGIISEFMKGLKVESRSGARLTVGG